MVSSTRLKLQSSQHLCLRPTYSQQFSQQIDAMSAPGWQVLWTVPFLEGPAQRPWRTFANSGFVACPWQ